MMRKKIQNIARQVTEITAASGDVNSHQIDEALAAIDSAEHEIYAEIQYILRGFNPRIDVAQQTELFSTVNELSKQLRELTDIQASLIDTLIKQKHFWCKEKATEFSVKKLSEIYHSFIQKLKFETDDINFKHQMFAQILKLMSQPNGQRLIYELACTLAKGEVINVKENRSGFKASPDDSALVCPTDIFERTYNVFQVSTDGHLISFPPFIWIAHELIHMQHFFDKTYERNLFKIQIPADIILLWDNFEEFVTIQSEYTICSEHKIGYRCSHVSTKFNPQTPQITNIFIHALFFIKSKMQKDFQGYTLLNYNCKDHLYLDGFDFTNARLRYCDFRNAILRDAILNGADLRSADLRGADLTNADLRGANLEFALIDEKTCLTYALIDGATNMRYIRREGDNIYFAEDSPWLFANYPEKKIVAYIMRELEAIKSDATQSRQIRLQMIKELIGQLQHTELQANSIYRRLFLEYDVNCSAEILDILEQNSDPYLTVKILSSEKTVTALSNYSPSRLRNVVSHLLGLKAPEFEHLNEQLQTLIADLSAILIREQQAIAAMTAIQLDGRGIWAMPVSTAAVTSTSLPTEFEATQQRFVPTVTASAI